MTMPILLSTAQARAVDEALAARTGLPTLVLMENAGRGIAERIWLHHGVARGATTETLRVGIVCGPGNNGGDGFVVARQLAALGESRATGAGGGRAAGVAVRVFLASPAAKLAGDASLMHRALANLTAVGVEDWSMVDDGEAWRGELARCDVVVDALFGTGLRAALAGVPAVAVAAMNRARAAGRPLAIVSVDIPSGMDADTGRAQGEVVRADLTVTMGAKKLGLLVEAGAPVGEVEVVSLGIPLELAGPDAQAGGQGERESKGDPSCYELTEAFAREILPRRGPAAHKGSSGHLIVIAGSAGKTGAAYLVGRSAMRAGAGLVTIASTAAGQVALDAKVIELMTAAYAASGSDVEDADDASLDRIERLLKGPGVRAVAIGPGIPTGDRMRAVVRELVASVALPMVVDADALNLLGDEAAARLARGAPAPRVITPHPGEMARLTGRTVAAVEADRVGVARGFSRESRAVVVLKGAHTVIATPDGTAFVSGTAEPALATAGSGDVLTGIIGALLAQGLPALSAAQVGVRLHLGAGALAAGPRGGGGVVAADLPDAIAAVRAAWRS